MHQDLSRDDSVDEIKRKIFQATRQVLDEVQSITPPELIEEAAKIFFAGEQRDLYGVGGSATVCHDASHKFLRIGIRSTVFSDTHMMMMSASLLSKRDVVLAVSHSGQTMDLLGAVDLAKKNGARIIALTNSFASDLAKSSDIVLCAPAKDSPLIGQNATARIAQLTLIDSFFMCLARQNYDLAEENLHKTMSSIRSFPWMTAQRSRTKKPK
jgi:DNA-binding MurR/RpiR family transcriptional regulator